MKTTLSRSFLVAALTLAVAAGSACGPKAQAPAAAGKTAAEASPEKAAPSEVLLASAFELNMRILEGGREQPMAPHRAVTSSYLELMTFANFEDEENVATDEQIKKVFNIKDLGLLTEANLVWEKGDPAKAVHVFRINGREYLVAVTPGRLPERNHYHIEVNERGGGKTSSLLDTEFSLPDKTAAVFGFEDSEAKSYFITLRVSRWMGEPFPAETAAGGAAGGVVSGVLKSGEKIKPPKLIKEVEPAYPDAARKAGIEGLVIMEATTDTYGRVAEVKVLRSIPLLDQAAVDAVKQWVYEPMVIDGKPRPVTFTVTTRFRLDDKKKPRVEGGVAGGVSGGVQGGVEGGVEGGVVGGVASAEAAKKFEGDAVRAVGEVKPPELIKQVDPVYPDEARKAGIEGIVILEAKADEEGNVSDARILRSIPALDQAALDAVKQWKYEPMLIDGKPHKIVFTVTVRFSLKEGGSAKALEKFAEGAVKAEGEIQPPKLIKEVQPVYPEAARQAQVQGVVILGVKTDVHGRVADTIVLRSIPLLDQAAIDAVKQWVYEPFLKDGRPGPVVFTVTVRFQLK
jgi:TonB family protein